MLSPLNLNRPKSTLSFSGARLFSDEGQGGGGGGGVRLEEKGR